MEEYKGERLKNMLAHYARTHGGYVIKTLCASALARIEQLEKLDCEAANYVECPIVMRTDFTGEPPYVGWKGLGLALTEALDERDALLTKVQELSDDPDIAEKAKFVALNYDNLRKTNKELLARVDLLERNIKLLYETTIKENENDVCPPQSAETGESS